MSEINLLPWRLLIAKQTNQKFLIGAGIVTLCSLCIVYLLHFYSNLVINKYRQEGDRLMQKLTAYNHAQHLLHTKNNKIRKLETERFMLLNLLNTLTNIIPHQMTLSRIEKHGKAIICAGFVSQKSTVSKLIASLLTTPDFSAPELHAIEDHKFKLGFKFEYAK